MRRNQALRWLWCIGPGGRVARHDENHPNKMGLLSLLRKNKSTKLMRLPSGSFTLDPDGNIMTSTLPQSFPLADIQYIGRCVLAALQSANKCQMPLTELIIN